MPCWPGSISGTIIAALLAYRMLYYFPPLALATSGSPAGARAKTQDRVQVEDGENLMLTVI
jgi:hypothetical protein